MEKLPDRFSLHWTNDLSVGCVALDECNRQMFGELARVEQQLTENSIEQLSRWLSTRLNQFELLLHSEEKLLAAADYPELTFHQQLHWQATEMIRHIRLQLAECTLHAALALLVQNSCSQLALWLMQHILDADKLFFPYVDARYLRLAEVNE